MMSNFDIERAKVTYTVCQTAEMLNKKKTIEFNDKFFLSIILDLD